MLILACDLARRTGWAFGPAGVVPQSGSWVLRKPNAPVEGEGPELIRNIEALLGERRPDLIVVEDWLRLQGKTTQSVTEAQILLHGGINTWAGRRGIRLVRVAASTVRKHVCGRSSAGDRDSTKTMVRDTLVLLGLVAKGETDLDRTDAVCVWRWAEDMHAGVRGRFALVPA